MAASGSLRGTFKLAMCQLLVRSDKAANVSAAVDAIGSAAKDGARVVVLPECFNSPYGTSFFPNYAECIPGPSTDALSKAAKEHGVFVIGGSIPEKAGEKLYNTCTVFNPYGEMVATFRKIHLFDISVPGGITFKESDTLSPGKDLAVVDTGFCKIGLGICYDIRFPEIAQLYAKMGCDVVCYPGAFNMTTGPVHWEMLARSRALDNQMFSVVVSPARDDSASYVAWGHSLAVDPWGQVITKANEKPGIHMATIDLDRLEEVRTSIPLVHQRRHDVYCLNLIEKKKL